MKLLYFLPPASYLMILMVEQSHVRKRHRHAVLVTAVDHCIIADGAAGLSNVFHAALVGAFNVVAEWEEGVGAQRHVLPGVQEGSLFRVGQGCGLRGEVLLPVAVGADIFLILVNVAVDDIVPFGAAQISAEGQVQHLLMLAQEPGVRFGTRQTGAVDTALLAGAHTDGLAVQWPGRPPRSRRNWTGCTSG